MSDTSASSAELERWPCEIPYGEFVDVHGNGIQSLSSGVHLMAAYSSSAVKVAEADRLCQLHGEL
jgi:hypothetical protein